MASRRVFLLGASGSIGPATLTALVARGHEVTCFLRPAAAARMALPRGVSLRMGDVTDPAALRRDGFCGEGFDAIVSCLASRSGTPDSARAIDHAAHSHALAAGEAAGVTQFVLLSAICVQRPQLAFQHAKLAFERELVASGLNYSIVRPTAYFKSLSGQVDRLRRGKPYLLFGDGRLTACKPISNADLGAYLADCVDDPISHNLILPIGGPGPAQTPREMGEMLFALLGQKPRFRQVPLALLDGIIAVLSALGRLSPALRDKAELARIGRYYATESMLVLDPATGRYDADATPETGSDTLAAHYIGLLRGDVGDERGEHAVF